MARKNQVRESQAITTYGTGSIIDVPGMSLMALAPDYKDLSARGEAQEPDAWGSPANALHRVHDLRLSRHFHNTEFFVRPPAGEAPGMGIPVCRFPSAMFCPGCHVIHIEDRNFYRLNIFTTQNNNHLNDRDEPYFCPRCHQQAPAAKRKRLIPARFVIATKEGHIDDFPWLWFVTRNLPDRTSRRAQRGLIMRLKSTGQTTSIADLVVSLYEPDNDTVPICEESLASIFNTDEEGRSEIFNDPSDRYLDFTGNMMPKPWQGRNQAGMFLQQPVSMGESPRALQRGAGNVYFPIIWSSIRLPVSAGGGIYTELAEELYNMLPAVRNYWDETVDMLEPEMSPDDRVHYFITLFQKTEASPSILKKKLLNHLKIGSPHSPDHVSDLLMLDLIGRAYSMAQENAEAESAEDRMLQLRQEEFDFFLQPYLNPTSFWYQSTIVPGSSYGGGLSDNIETVVLLNKLNELRVFRGFTRVMPLLTQDLIFSDPVNLHGALQQEFNRINDPRRDPESCPFLPASEVRGEGIFIRFRSAVLLEWEDHPEIVRRHKQIAVNHEAAHRKRQELNGAAPTDLMQGFSPRSARYVLLHTLAHQIIRELSMDSGYNTASLREIIYCGRAEDGMDGILIYTAASDAEGTMGGLVALGRPGSLENIMGKALRNSAWCSSDPLCLDSRGQGFQSLNLAACHACSLLPETSCEAMNGFLDRGMLHGSLENPNFGFASRFQAAKLPLSL